MTRAEFIDKVKQLLEELVGNPPVRGKAHPPEKPKCRCYINSKYYARQARTGGAGMKNYKPCPIHGY